MALLGPIETHAEVAAKFCKDEARVNMHEAMRSLTLEPGRFATFIAGPSKTADIEQALVAGAHGLCSLTLSIVG